jgi:TonB dependent receptor-like, beta-barrel/Carboxypeptidase regulatory-like domain/TonB-dependent Receptor Plug Domain
VKTLRLLIVLSLATEVARAQPPDQAEVAVLAVDGRVIDALGRPVANATVTVEGTTNATRTNKAGRFHLDGVHRGDTVVVDHDGFSTGLATVEANAIDDIVLLSQKQATETIEVKGQAPPETPGAAKLDRTELTRVPGTGGDLVRTLSVMPGVVNFPFPTAYNGVVIRGSAPEDSKFLIDGFEVPLLYHDIGFRSIVPTEAIENLEYIPGGFDVAYGRAASGIVSLTTRPGADRRGGQAEVSVIDSGVIAQGSADKLRYMVAFRRSVIDLLLPALLPPDLDLSLTTVPRYYDEQVRLDYALDSHWKLTLSSIGSDDALEIFADKSENPDKRFYNRTRFVRTSAIAKWHDGAWNGTFGISTMPLEFVFERGVFQHIDVKQVEFDTRAEITHTEKDVAGLTDLVWRVGEQTNVSRFDVSIALPPQPREGQPMGGPPDDMDVSNQFKGIEWTPDVGVWTALTGGLSPRIRATVGLRVDAFARTGDVATQPRGELSWKVAPKTTVRLSAGAYRRPPENQEELEHTDLHPERSTQTILGVEYEPREGIRFQGSAYFTDRTHLIIRGDDGVLRNSGRGETYGVEGLATVRQGPWFVWLTAALSHSTRQDTPMSDVRLFEFDQPLSINAAASWQSGKWQLGGRFQLYSGLPLTPITGAIFDSDRNFYQPVFGPIYSERAPMHHQLDLRVDRSWRWGPVAMTWFIDVQNVYLNQSTVAYFYSYDYTQRSAFKSLPIIPSIGLRGVL